MISTRYALFLALFSLLAPSPTLAVERAVLRIGGTGSAAGTFKQLAEAFQKANPGIEIKYIPSLGSSGAIKALQAGTLEIALSARNLKSSEQPLRAQEIGRTPLVIAVSSKSSAHSISLEELARMIEGSLTTWPDGSPLRLILRPDSDTETVYLRAISPRLDLALNAARKRPGLQVAITGQDAADALEKIPGALGLSTLTLIVSEKRALKPLKLDGKQASVATLASGEYPYYKPIFAVTLAQPSDATQAFIAFIQSGSGARILSSNAYLPSIPATP